MKAALTKFIATTLQGALGIVLTFLVAQGLLGDAEATKISSEALATIMTASVAIAALVVAVMTALLERIFPLSGNELPKEGNENGDSGGPGGAALLLLLGTAAVMGFLPSCSSLAGTPIGVRITDGAGNGLTYDSKDGIGVVVVLPDQTSGK